MNEQFLVDMSLLVVNEGWAERLVQIGEEIDVSQRASFTMAYQKLLKLSQQFWSQHRAKFDVLRRRSAKIVQPRYYNWTQVSVGPQNTYTRFFKSFFTTPQEFTFPIFALINHLGDVDEKNGKEKVHGRVDRENVHLVFARCAGPVMTKIFQKLDDRQMEQNVQRMIYDLKSEADIALGFSSSSLEGWIPNDSEGSKVASLSRVTFGQYQGKPSVLKMIRPRQMWMLMLETLFIEHYSRTAVVQNSEDVRDAMMWKPTNDAAEVLVELAFGKEAQNAQWAKQAYGKVPNLRIPDVYLVKTRPHPIMIMQRATGLSFSELPKREPASYYDGQLVTFLEFANTWLSVLSTEKKAHGDPHPGNFVVDMTTNEMYLIDFGAIATFNAEEIRRIIHFIMTAAVFIAKNIVPAQWQELSWSFKASASFLVGNPTFEDTIAAFEKTCNFKIPSERVAELKRRLNGTLDETALIQIIGLINDIYSIPNDCHQNSLMPLMRSAMALGASFNTISSLSGQRPFEVFTQWTDRNTFTLFKISHSAFFPKHVYALPITRQSIDLFLMHVIDDVLLDVRFIINMKSTDTKTRALLGTAEVVFTLLRSVDFRKYIQGTDSYPGWLAVLGETAWDAFLVASKVLVAKKGLEFSKLSETEKQKIIKQLTAFSVRQGVVVGSRVLRSFIYV